MDQQVLVEARGAVLEVTLNRPEARNAMTRAAAEAIGRAMDRLDADPALRCAILTGAGGTFCSGMDLKGFLKGELPVDARGGFGGITTWTPDKPVIAAVDGHALAGGFELMISCDLVVANSKAKFGIPEAKRGLAAAAGGVTSLAVLPNTEPPIDDPAMVEFVARRARQVKLVKVHPYAAVTKGLAGRELAEIGLLKAAGAVAFTDGEKAIANARVMRRALSYALAIVSRNRDWMFWTVQQGLLFPLMLLSGMLLPLEAGPRWMQILGRFNPLTYIVDAERALFSGSFSDPAILYAVIAAVLLVGTAEALTGRSNTRELH